MAFWLIILPLLGRLGRSGICQISGFKLVTFILIGLIYGLLMGCTDWVLLGFVLANVLFEVKDPASDSIGRITDGLNTPYGNRKDYLALAKRGLFPGGLAGAAYIALLCGLTYLGYPAWLFLSLTLWWPLTAYIGTKLPDLPYQITVKGEKQPVLAGAWRWSEGLRPLVMGIILVP